MIHLVRHGETEWSRTRRHTGRTDIPLTGDGRRQAAGLRPILERLPVTTVLSSPLLRARETAALTGRSAGLIVDDRLREWDYGAAEGRTTEELRRETPGWSVWTHSIEGGEQLADVARRADEVIGDLAALPGDVLVFGHAHLFRVLAARWCGFPAGAGARFVLDPASVSTLGQERSTRCVIRWNVGASAMADSGKPLHVPPISTKGAEMSGNMDDLKGRAKEAAGDLTDDKDLEREGKVDRASGAMKDKIDDVKDAAKDALDRDRH